MDRGVLQTNDFQTFSLKKRFSYSPVKLIDIPYFCVHFLSEEQKKSSTNSHFRCIDISAGCEFDSPGVNIFVALVVQYLYWCLFFFNFVQSKGRKALKIFGHFKIIFGHCHINLVDFV